VTEEMNCQGSLLQGSLLQGSLAAAVEDPARFRCHFPWMPSSPSPLGQLREPADLEFCPFGLWRGFIFAPLWPKRVLLEYEAAPESRHNGHAPFVSFAQESDSGKARVVLAGAQAVSRPATARGNGDAR
jgi:hypothetical protein